MLALIYLETVIPSYALGMSRAAHRYSGMVDSGPGKGGKQPVNMIHPSLATVLPAGAPVATAVPVVKKKADMGGPTQPESQAFHSVNNDNMVDLFTGDFSYTIPLMDVGGYPITIGYNSGISMDQEASWVGLGWNINPGTITRNLRGLPDDFSGRDTIVKTANIKENKTVGVTTGADVEVIGLPLEKGKANSDTAKIGLSVGASLGFFHNTYRGWGMEFGLNSSINVGKSGMGGFTSGLSVSNNSQEGLSISPSFAAYTMRRQADGINGSLSISSTYNSRAGVKGLQLSGGLRQTEVSQKNVMQSQSDRNTSSTMGSTNGTFISFAYPSYTPSISLPYTSQNITVTLKAGFETKVVHPSFFISGYVSKQSLAESDRTAYLPAYGYLNYQHGAGNPGALLDFNREKEIPYREKPAVAHIAVPSYTYDVFSISGEGTGGMFRAYRSDIGFVYDHAMRTRDGSQRFSGDIGFGDLVHGGVDLNFTRAFTQTGPWLEQNPLASVIGFKDSDTTFEAAYFRNPGEKAVNSREFYEAIGGDDVVAPDLYQAGAVLSTTHRLSRYRNGRLEEKIPLPASAAFRKKRDKRTQVISYLTAEEASEAGFQQYIESYQVNEFGVRNCDTIVPEVEEPEGLLGEYFNYGWPTRFDNKFWEKIDPVIYFEKNSPDHNMNVGKPANGQWLDKDFSARWTGRLKAPVTGTYKFVFTHDDGVRLFINDVIQIDRWLCQSPGDEEQRTAYVNLVAGEMYDVKIEYYQSPKNYHLALYWSYPGQPQQIIPTEYLYLMPSKDTFVTGIVSRENRVNSFRKKHHISEIDVLNADGRRYIYGIPVYNIKQKDVTFSVDPIGANVGNGLVKYTPGEDDTTANFKGNDHYFNKEEVPAYAHSFLLTGIVSPDYADLTGDGISPDDPGDAIKFNYSKVAGVRNTFTWRAPYTDSAAYNEGLKTDTRDDRGSYVYGEKELWYLHSIESKNMIATFKLGDRKDMWPVDENGNKSANGVARKLEEINLYTKADFLKYGTNAIPVKTVHFGYSYKLCRGVNGTVNNLGKLTLDTIWFSYNGNDKGKRNPYIFHYNNNNPDYNIKSYDRWGNYKDPLQNPGSSASNFISNPEYPYALQDSATAAQNAAAWTLDSIVLPSGGRMKVVYESDDYAYVQNRRAMQFFKVAGFSAAPPSTLNDLNNELYGGQEDYLYVAINVPDPVTSLKELAYKYLAGLEKISFRLNVRMPSDRFGGGNEYIPCYARIDPSGEAGFINDGHTIWVKLKGIDAAGDDGSYSPLAQAAVQFLRLNLPSKAMPGSDVGDDLDLDVAVKVLMSLADNIKNTLNNFNDNARAKGWAKEVDTSRTLARLHSPRFKKYGGGLRVKRLLIYDHWNAMTRQKESVYGQEYQYTTVKEVAGIPMEISSGVATYEPMLGGEENPWRLPIEYKQQVAPLAPVSMGYTEEPLGESFFPAPSVGYSKVRIRSIHAKNTRSANGYQETSFYTSYDFPVITEMTTLSDSKKRYRPALANFLRIDAKHYLAISQGFKVELNDMNGKLRSQATYAETNDKTPITYAAHYYRVDNQQALFRHLNNTAMVINPKGEIDPAASIGKDVELMMDMREQHSVTNGNNFNVNGDFFTFSWPPVWMLPSFLSLFQREENKFRSAAATKVINRHGILDSIVVIEKGSKVVTRNLLFDSETGNPVLTSTKNEFDDPIYHFTYPAAWAYDGMSGAYKNIGLTVDNIRMRGGKIISGISEEDANRYFTGGDELLVWSHQKTGGIGFCNIEVASWPNSSRLWVVDANAFTGGAPDIYFVDSDGVPFSGDRMSMKVIRSGRKNIAATVGTVNMLENPLVKSIEENEEVWSLVIGDSSKVIDATAMEFQQFWKVADKRKVSYVSNCVPQTYEQYINDGECLNPPYLNEEISQVFTKNDCGTGGIPSTYQYVVPAGTYTSTVSQEQADSLAWADVAAYGQIYTNDYVTCTYHNKEIKRSFTKNDCPGDTLSDDCGVAGAVSTTTYTVPAGRYTSIISQEDADAYAEEEMNTFGQAYANSTGTCTYYNIETSRAFTRNDCPGGSVVIYTVPERTYMSTESPEQADSLAEADIQRNGQAYANAHGSCTATCQINVMGRTEADTPDELYPYSITVRSTLTGEPYSYTRIPDTDLLTTLPYCIAFEYQQNDALQIEIGAQNGIYAIINDKEKYGTNSIAAVFNDVGAPPFDIILSKTERPVFENSLQFRNIAKNDCSEGLSGSLVRYEVPAGTYTSTISLEDANNKAIAHIDMYGQGYANENGICVEPNTVRVMPKAGGVAPGANFTVTVKDVNTNEVLLQREFIGGDGIPYDNTSLSVGTYRVEVSASMETLRVIVNAEERTIASGASESWTVTTPIVVEVSKQ
ncbi:hypothetical protein GCM10009415_28930 [Chitinophaga japonensis]